MGAVFHLNKGSTPVKPSPYARCTALVVIALTAFMAERAVIFMPFVQAGLDADMVHAVRIRKEIAAGDNGGLDI